MNPTDAHFSATLGVPASLRKRFAPAMITLRSWIAAGIAFVALCVAAQLRVPVPGSPVPMTLQSFVVLLIGLTLPARIGFGATLAYIASGTAGLPILANPAGLSGITGGYLIGFAVAAPLMAILRGQRSTVDAQRLFASFTGLFVILGLGVTWQCVGFGGSWRAALGVGLLPFVGKSVIEAFLAVALVRVGRSWFAGRTASES